MGIQRYGGRGTVKSERYDKLMFHSDRSVLPQAACYMKGVNMEPHQLAEHHVAVK